MSDAYKELLIKQQTNPLEKVFAIILLIAAGISLLSGIFVHPLFLIAVVACPIVAFFIYFRKMEVEYEYTYMSRELRIDRIFNQSKRKSVATLDLDKMEILAVSGSDALGSMINREVKTFDFSTKTEDADGLTTFEMYYNGKEKYIVSFNEDMVKAIQSLYMSKVKLS